MAKLYRIEDWAGNVMSKNGKFYPARSPWLHPKLFPSFEEVSNA